MRVLDLAAISSEKKLATNAVTAGMMKIAPAASPKPAAIASTHNSACSGVCMPGPVTPSR